MLKVNPLMVIRRFSYNFPKIYWKTIIGDLHERASQARLLNSSKSRILRTSEASFASERPKRGSRKSSKPSIVRTSEASFASDQAKCNLRKPAKAKQTMQQTPKQISKSPKVGRFS